jgi:hypothetical protein
MGAVGAVHAVAADADNGMASDATSAIVSTTQSIILLFFLLICFSFFQMSVVTVCSFCPQIF